MKLLEKIIGPLKSFFGALYCACLVFHIPAEIFAQGTIIVPQNFTTQYGNARLYFQGSHQQIIGQNLFQSLPSDEVLLTGVSFRHAFGESINRVLDITIRVGTFSKPLSEVSMFRGENLGADQITVFTATQASVVASASTPPSIFEVGFDFQTPFLFNRTKGGLVLDLTLSSPGGPGYIDFADGNTGEMVYLLPGAFGGSLLPNSGIISNFKYITIPEPSQVFVGSIGLFIFTIRRKFK